MTLRKRLDETYTTLLTDESSEMQIPAVAPTSTLVEISPQHSTQDSKIVQSEPEGSSESEEQTPPNSLESSSVFNCDQQTTSTANNTSQLQLLIFTEPLESNTQSNNCMMRN